MYICGEHLPRMWHLLRKTNGYHYTIIRTIKRFDTYEGNPPENVVPYTYDSPITVNNNRLNVTPHRSYRHSTGNLFRAPNLFGAGKLFRAGRTFLAETPVSPGIPRPVRPDSGTHRVRFNVPNRKSYYKEYAFMSHV